MRALLFPPEPQNGQQPGFWDSEREGWVPPNPVSLLCGGEREPRATRSRWLCLVVCRIPTMGERLCETLCVCDGKGHVCVYETTHVTSCV